MATTTQPVDDQIPAYRSVDGVLQCARELGMPPGSITHDAVRTAIRRGQLTPRMLGNAYFFSKDQVRKWLTAEGAIRKPRKKVKAS